MWRVYSPHCSPDALDSLHSTGQRNPANSLLQHFGIKKLNLAGSESSQLQADATPIAWPAGDIGLGFLKLSEGRCLALWQSSQMSVIFTHPVANFRPTCTKPQITRHFFCVGFPFLACYTMTISGLHRQLWWDLYLTRLNKHHFTNVENSVRGSSKVDPTHIKIYIWSHHWQSLDTLQKERNNMLGMKCSSV